MALPLKGDPRRELTLSIRISRALSFILFFVTLISLAMVIIRRAPGNSPSRFESWMSQLILLLFVGQMVYSSLLSRRYRASIPGLQVISVLQILLLIPGILYCIAHELWFLIPFCVLWLLGMIQFLYYLSNAGKGIDAEMSLSGQIHGFEPIMNKPVVPAPAPLPNKHSTET